MSDTIRAEVIRLGLIGDNIAKSQSPQIGRAHV